MADQRACSENNWTQLVGTRSEDLEQSLPNDDVKVKKTALRKIAEAKIALENNVQGVPAIWEHFKR